MPDTDDPLDMYTRTAPGILWRGARREPVAGGVLACSADVRVLAGNTSTTRYFPSPLVTIVQEFLFDVTSGDLFSRVRASAPEGWDAASARGVSDDGKVVAGNGRLNGLPQVWVAHLP